MFAGRALEYLERKICSDSLEFGDERRAVHDTGSVTRFRVQHSLDLPVGSEVLVFTSPYSSCSTFFRIGDEHLVAAHRTADQLHASRCPMLNQNVVEELRALLHVPSSSSAGLRPPYDGFAPFGCSRPATVDDAVAGADAVVWTDSRASCMVGEGPVVEHAAVATRAWKGLAPGDFMRLQVTGRADDDHPRFAFESELADATNRWWPPAEFLRRAGDVYVNDGCLSPLPPTSLQEGVDGVTRLLPLSDGPQLKSTRCVDLPALSCGTLNQALFVEAGDRLAAVYRQRRLEYETEQKNQRASFIAAQSVERQGSCAGCSIPNSPPFRSGMPAAGIALVLLSRRRRRRGA